MFIQTLITDYFPIYINKKRKYSYDIDLYDSNEYSNKVNCTKNNKIAKVYGFNPETENWHCLECGDDMGPNNPRQLCGKYFCHKK
jgi:hypothetical protein